MRSPLLALAVVVATALPAVFSRGALAAGPDLPDRPPPPDRAACLEAYVAAQDAREAGRLLTARGKLEICVDPACPGMMKRDCAQWLEENRRMLPSIVLVARDDAGRDVLDAKGTVDGAPVQIDGRVLVLDPGKHVVAIQIPSGVRREETILLAEGEHDRAVVLTLPSTLPVERPLRVAPRAVDVTTAPLEPHGRPVPVPSWVLGGLSVVSLGAFGVFAVKGVSDRASLGCDRACGASSYDTVNGEFLVADVALGAGVALLGAAIAWWAVDGRAPAASAGPR